MHRMFYPGGAFSLASALFWAVRSRGTEDVTPVPRDLQRGFDSMPLVEADDRAAEEIPFFDDWVRHSTRDEYWESIDGHGRIESLRSPVFLSAGWYDPFLPGQLADFERIRASGQPGVADASRLIIGPWAHAETVSLPGSPDNRNYRLESLAPSLPWFGASAYNESAETLPLGFRFFVFQCCCEPTIRLEPQLPECRFLANRSEPRRL
jgi:hypothetical protein